MITTLEGTYKREAQQAIQMVEDIMGHLELEASMASKSTASRIREMISSYKARLAAIKSF